jgi:pimeloyl-ACP methyl ester carboxylesterase
MQPMIDRYVDANGVRMHVVEAGEGPLVVLLHGFPELAYSWRHQLEALAEAGFHAVAPDQRGYGGTTAPEPIESYHILALVGDVVGLVRALGEHRCVVVGHDWGSPVASSLGLFRPDLVRGVGLLSVPYTPRGDVDMLTAMHDSLGPGNYVEFFQEPGVAEAVLGADPRTTMRSTLIGSSGDAPEVFTGAGVGDGTGLTLVGEDVPLPAWLTERDVDVFAAAFERTGFRGGLNWYRNARRNWELTAPWHGAPLLAPSLFACGDRDLVYQWPGMRELIGVLGATTMPNLTKAVVLEGCGHWIQQERPDDVNRLLVEFCSQLPE